MILIVDDHVDSAIALKRLLTMQGFEAHAAFSGQEALAFMTGTSVSLAILDYHMPDLDGLMLYRIMQATPALRHIPVMVFSAWEGEAREAGLREGIIAWIAKGSLDAAILNAHVTKILGPPASKRCSPAAQRSESRSMEAS